MNSITTSLWDRWGNEIGTVYSAEEAAIEAAIAKGFNFMVEIDSIGQWFCPTQTPRLYRGEIRWATDSPFPLQTPNETTREAALLCIRNWNPRELDKLLLSLPHREELWQVRLDEDVLFESILIFLDSDTQDRLRNYVRPDPKLKLVSQIVP